MKKYIMLGGFDYAVKWEMNQDAIFKGIDCFVETDQRWIGKTYLGKPIYSVDKLLEEDKNEILILIGSIIHHTELEFLLWDMGFEKDKHYVWAISFPGDEKCPRLWYHTEWNDRNNNVDLESVEKGEYSLERMKVVSKIIPVHIKTIVDLGAANERLAPLLGEDTEYIPCDYIKYSERTRVCDFNKKEFPTIGREKESTCVVGIGVVQYVNDWKWFISEIVKICDTFICVHSDFARISREYRREHYTANIVLFNHEIILEMQKHGFRLVEAYDFRLKVVIMKFVRE